MYIPVKFNIDSDTDIVTLQSFIENDGYMYVMPWNGILLKRRPYSYVMDLIMSGFF